MIIETLVARLPRMYMHTHHTHTHHLHISLYIRMKDCFVQLKKFWVDKSAICLDICPPMIVCVNRSTLYSMYQQYPTMSCLGRTADTDTSKANIL